MDALTAMGQMLKIVAVFLLVWTVVLSMAVVYVMGVEQGVNSQQPEMAQLYRQLYPGILVDFLPYLHPLRNFLFGSALFLGICWTVFLTGAIYNGLKKRERRLQLQA